jgi:hypothetical protein
MNKLLIGIGILVIVSIGYGFGFYAHEQKKYKMNLKCVQGELYEEIKTNMFVKSHLECFEQRTLTP